MSFLSEPVSLIPIQPLRQIGPIKVSVVISESSADTLSITRQPVQQGASITDHSYLEPVSLTMTIYFSANLTASLETIYLNLRLLQSDRTPFTVITPKRVYRSMLMTTLSQTTDKNTENCLAVTISFQQIILVSVSAVNVPRSAMSNPASNGATQPAGQKSSQLYKIDQAGGNFLSNLFPGAK